MNDPLAGEIAEMMLEVRSPTFADALRLTHIRFPVATDVFRYQTAGRAVVLYYDTYQFTKQALYGKT